MRCIAANDLRDGRLRITVTGGESPLGSERGDAAPTVIVAASELAPPAPDADVVTVPWSRNERSAIAGLKTISYAENVRALAYAREHGAIEAVFPNSHGDLCEATGSNVFLVFQSVLHTPPGEAGCLLGVTRALILELAAGLGIPIEEAALPLDALHRCDEAFLSSTTREVQAIAHVDGQQLPAVCGPITSGLADRVQPSSSRATWIRSHCGVRRCGGAPRRRPRPRASRRRRRPGAGPSRRCRSRCRRAGAPVARPGPGGRSSPAGGGTHCGSRRDRRGAAA